LYFPQLTLTRFIFAFLILVYHAGRDAFPFNIEIIDILFRVRRETSFFFLLSGFMLTIGYWERIGKLNVIHYFMGRVARIYPVYLVSIAMTLPLYMYGIAPNIDINPVLVNLFLVQGCFTQYLLSMNPPSWSLSVLWFFYALFPFLLRRVLRMSRMASTTFTWLLWTASVVSYAIILEIIGGRETSASHRFFLYGPLLHLNVFVMGIWSAILFKEAHGRIRQKQSTALIVVSIVTMIIVLLFVKNPDSRLFQNGIFAPLFVMLIFGLITDRSWLSRILTSRPCVLLGEISYCVYILQWPVINYTGILMRRLGISVTPTERFYIILAILLVVSFSVHSLVEKPGRRIVLEKFRRGTK